MDFKAKRVTWRGQQYDSQLEADWAATLVMWGVEHEYHPGQLYVSVGVYEPDFLVEGRERDVILEVKGWWDEDPVKPRLAREELGLDVVVGRTGWIPPVNDWETSGAVWEPEEWVVDPVTRMFVHDGGEGMYFSAPVAYRESREGIRMFKAVGEDGIA